MHLSDHSTTVPIIWQKKQLLCQVQKLKIRSFKRFVSFKTLVTVDQGGMQDLQWWNDHLSTGNDKNVNQSPPRLVIETNASLIEGSLQGCETQWPTVGPGTMTAHQFTGIEGRCL